MNNQELEQVARRELLKALPLARVLAEQTEIQQIWGNRGLEFDFAEFETFFYGKQ